MHNKNHKPILDKDMDVEEEYRLVKAGLEKEKEKEMSEKEMKFMQLGKKERKLLLKALDFNTENLFCEFCGEKISYERCSIMPSLSSKQATILCESPLCLCEYLTIMEG